MKIVEAVHAGGCEFKSRPPRSSKKPARAGFFVRGGRNVPAHVSPRLESRNDAVRRVRRGREIFACKNIRDQVSSAAQFEKTGSCRFFRARRKKRACARFAET